MITKITIEYDDSDFSETQAIGLAREALRRQKLENKNEIVIISALSKKPDVVVDMSSGSIQVRSQFAAEKK